MKKILLLTDYKNRFGSKHNDRPYRSGMDKDLLKKYFNANGFTIDFVQFRDIDFNFDFKDQVVLYTSSEDIGYHYKSFIEDIIYGLELAGANVIPAFKYLHANNNKVFMEILRKELQLPGGKMDTSFYGTLEEVLDKSLGLSYPVVFKLAEGASGSNVALAKSRNELISIIKKFSRTEYLLQDLRDTIRALKHKGYTKESLYRKKFIVQNFIPDLKNDWKIYVFGGRFYIFNRPLQPGRGFRASGGGYDNYFYGVEAKAPDGIFDFASNIFNKLNVPHSSLDIAFDGKQFYLIEFQCLYFGTAGILNSKEYFTQQNNTWVNAKNEKDIELTYVQSIVNYIKSI